MIKMNDASNRTLTMERTFDAPIQLVWEAWSQPEHITQWWGPKGMENKVIEHDFSVGGKWKYSMMMPDGKEFIADGQYIEIVTLEKIISSANFKPMTEGVEIQALFRKDGEKTHFTFNGLITVELNSVARYLELSVVDENGKSVHAFSLSNEGGAVIRQMDVSHLSPGTYITRLQSSNGSSAARFIKQ